MLFFKRAIFTVSVYCKNISDKMPEDRAAQLFRRFG